MVRQQQQYFYGKRYELVCLNKRPDCPPNCKGPSEACPPYVLDFTKWAGSYGVDAIRIEKEEEILPALEQAAQAQKDGRSMVLEFMVATDEVVLPMVKGGMANSDMILK